MWCTIYLPTLMDCKAIMGPKVFQCCDLGLFWKLAGQTFRYLWVELHIIWRSPLCTWKLHCCLPTQISRQAICLVWLLVQEVLQVLQVCTVQKVQKAPEGHISTKHILFRAILWCCHIEEWLLLKGDPVASEPLWLTTVTMLSPSLLLQPQSLLKSQS